MRLHQYFRNGRQISPAEALDERGLIRDGVTMRTSMMARDSKSHRLVDGNGSSDPLAFSRPGFRQLADASVDESAPSCLRRLPSRPPDRLDGRQEKEIHNGSIDARSDVGPSGLQRQLYRIERRRCLFPQRVAGAYETRPQWQTCLCAE